MMMNKEVYMKRNETDAIATPIDISKIKKWKSRPLTSEELNKIKQEQKLKRKDK